MTAGAAQTLGAGYETLSNIDFNVFQANTEKYTDVVHRVYIGGSFWAAPYCPYLRLMIFRTNPDMSGFRMSSYDVHTMDCVGLFLSICLEDIKIDIG